MTSADTIPPPGQSFSIAAETAPDEVVPATLALLTQLQTSLEASQRALLFGDLQALEAATLEQKRLEQALRQELTLPDDFVQRPESLTEIRLPGAVIAALARVLHLGRVQSALLRRAQRSLGMIGRLLVGPEAEYGYQRRGFEPDIRLRDARWTPSEKRFPSCQA